MKKRNDKIEDVTPELREEFRKFVEEHRNSPEKIYANANTPWEKLVAVEFFLSQEDRKLMKERQKHQDRILWAVFMVVVIATFAQCISTYLLPIFGVV